MVKISIDYTGDLHCATRHGPSGATVQTDAPVDNQGRGESFSPTDLVANALGSCMATTMAIFAKRSNIELKGLRIEVQKIMSSEGPRRIAKLPAEVWMPIPKSSDHEDVIENAGRNCPVIRSLNPGIETPITFHWADSL